MLDFETIKSYYDRKLWTKQMVRMAVVKKRISPEQYQEITVEIYEA